MLKIVIDGAGDMPAGWETTYGIQLLPLRVHFGESTYTQGPGFTRDDFYRLVRETHIIPKTSLPSIGQVKAFYRSIAQTGDTILSIHISSKLSGTFSTVESAGRELMEEMAGEIRVVAFDSGAGSIAQGFLAREARQLWEAGAALGDVIQRMEAIRREWQVIFTLDTLEYAYLSGRINFLQNALVSALKVKPIIILRDGILDMSEKVRTRHRALERVLDIIHERLGSRRANLAVVHAADPRTAQEFLEKACAVFNVNEAVIADLAIPVAANLGPGAIGIVAYPLEEKK